jgi:hypothetical protein
VVLAGWFTGLRAVMHGVFLTVAVAAFLPLVVIGFGVLVMGLVLVLAALTCDDGAGAGVEFVLLGTQLGPPYYRWLGRQRHPVFWGIPLGLLLGGVLLWGLIALLILPGESLTARILTEAHLEVERLRRETGRHPPPTPQGALALDRGGRVQVVRDGFDRPLHYRVAGSGAVSSYVITSLGYDGRPGRDDLCVGDSTRAARWLDKGARLLHGLERGGALERVRLLRCPAGSSP